MSTTGPQAGTTVDTTINVAQLLKQPAGATRRYHLVVDELPLGEGRTARHLAGPIKLTRVGQGLLLTGSVAGEVEVTCVRCLDEFTTPLALQLEDQFRPSIDVTSGVAVNYAAAGDAEDEYFLIDENHELDLTEVLRQAVWVAIPMMPICREDCPGIAVADSAAAARTPDAEATAASGDTRLAVLQSLLDATPADAESAQPERSDRSRPATAFGATD